MEIIDATIEKLEDPFGILSGERFEIFLTLNIEEDDELYSENGVMLKLIYAVEEAQSKIVQYDFIEKKTEQVLDFALEDDEEKVIDAYCQQLIKEYVDVD
ncbi:pullulanase [Bacillus sp. 7586-K]|uniref:Pullulanase n=1 Tax=Metabacillus niabensis TaxID=324854 RepID=A0ABT9Z3W8_9BACI|nr:DUF6509 family protein [Metabacillus niabensis]MDQ0226951.1 hypothetical protein [Metabacillus niabensis]PAD70179.1 pullulanase [Bacillus sp. 7586-K]